MPVKCIHRTGYTLEIDTETGAVETPEIRIKETNIRKNKTTMKTRKKITRFQISKLVRRIEVFEATEPVYTYCHHEARHYLSIASKLSTVVVVVFMFFRK
jgi:hypothetical protein